MGKTKTAIGALIVLFFAIALVSSSWTYKGQGFADNQVVVYITGSQLAIPGTAERFEAGPIPTLKPGETVNVPVDGITTPCKLSAFDRHSTATGTYTNGHLQNGVQLPEADYIVLKDDTRTHSKNWGTTEAVNSLEVAGCAVFWKTHEKMQVNDLSNQNGGLLDPHKSHQRGLDADVPLLCIDGDKHYSCGSQSKFDAETSWIMIKALASATPVQYIFLRQGMIDKLRNYANAHESNYELRQAILTHLLAADENHYSHFHIRFHCSNEDTTAGCIEQHGGFRGTGGIEPTIDEDTEGAEPAEVSSSAAATQAGGTNACSASEKLLSSATDPSMSFMDGLKVYIPGQAACGGVYPVIIQLGGIDEANPANLFLGSGGRGMEQVVKQSIANGGTPVIIVEPVDFHTHSNELWAGGFDYSQLMQIVRAKLSENNIQVQSVSLIGHSGSGCDPGNGVYKVIKSEKNLFVLGLEDTCYSATYATAIQRDLPPTTQLVSVNSGVTSGWPSGSRDFAGFENALGITQNSAQCNSAKYTYCKTNAAGTQQSFGTTSTSHYDAAKTLLQEILPRYTPRTS